MPAVDQQFLDVLQGLGHSVQQYGISRAINEANDNVKNIKSSLMPDMEKRRALQDLAQSSYASIAAGGGNPAQLAAIQNLMPPTPSSAQQAVLQGTLTGDSALTQAGNEIISADEDRTIRKMQFQASLQEQSQSRLFEQQSNQQGKLFNQQASLQDKNLQSAEYRAELAAQRQQHAKVSDAFITKIADIDSNTQQMQSILERLDKNKNAIGPIDGRLPTWLNSSDVNAFQADLGTSFDAYRKAVTGAGASVGELKMLEANVPNKTDSYETIKKKLAMVLNSGARTKGNILNTLKASGRDISGFGTPAEAVGAFKASPGQADVSAGAPAIQVKSFFTPNQ